MLKNKNIVAAIVAVVLFLISGACFALDAANIYDPSKYLLDSDVSLQLLRKIFGVVPGISQLIIGNNKTIISILFYAFNWGLFGCSGLFLCYTTIKLIAETSLEGGQMKGNITAVWTVLRVICGVGLLIPTNSGYSVANTLVMWVVIQSVSLANWTWYNVLDSLDSIAGVSTGLRLSSSTDGKGSVLQSKLLGDEMANSIDYAKIGEGEEREKVGTADVLRSLVCAEAIKYALSTVRTKTGKKNPGDSSASKVEPYFCENGRCTLPYIKSINNTKKTDLFDLIFPDNELSKDPDASLIKDPINSFSAENFNGICGSFALKEISDAGVGALQQVIGVLNVEAKRLVQISRNPLTKDTINPYHYIVGTHDNIKENLVGDSSITKEKKVTDSTPANYYVKKYSSANPPINNTDQNELAGLNIPQTARELLTATALYYQANMPQEKAFAQNQRAANKDIREEQKKYGWAVAGSYYRDINKKIIEQAQKSPPYTIIDPVRKSGTAREKYPFDSLFEANSISVSTGDRNVVNLLNKIYAASKEEAVSKDNSEYFTFFENAMEWVHYMPENAKFLRYNLEAAPIAATAGQDKGFASAFRYDANANYAGLIADQAIGVALIAVPVTSPAGLPLLVWLPSKYMDYHLDEIVNTWKTVMNNNSACTITISGNTINATDPISKLQLLGHRLIRESWYYFMDIKGLTIAIGVGYAVSAVISTIASTATGLGSFMGFTLGASLTIEQVNAMNSTIEAITRGLINADMTMGMAVFVPLLTTGITLAVYVPLIPYMLFLFGVVSWLIAVVTLMFAAPMISFLMLWSVADQENPLLSREAGEFVKQLIAMFVRPALMIAGLVVGVVLCNISIELLNYGFDAIIANSVKAEDAKFAITTRIEHVGGVVVYTFIMISLVNMSFSAIHLLYTEVMRIVGIQVGQGGGEAEKHMQEIKQGSESIASAAGGGIKDSAGAAKDIHASKGKPEKDKKSDTDVTKVETKAPQGD